MVCPHSAKKAAVTDMGMDMAMRTDVVMGTDMDMDMATATDTDIPATITKKKSANEEVEKAL